MPIRTVKNADDRLCGDESPPTEAVVLNNELAHTQALKVY